MAVNPYALDALRRLSSVPYSPEQDSSQTDPTVQLYDIAQQRADETKDRIIANQRAQAASTSPLQAQQYGGEAEALKNLLGSYQQDIAESPITQGINEADQYRQKEREAIMGGFQGGMYQGRQYANPIAAQAEAGRQMEQAKIEAPIRQAEAQAAGNLATEQARSKGAMELARLQGEQSQNYLQTLLGGGAQPTTDATGQPAFDIGRLRGFNPKTGGFTLGAEPKDPNINVQLAKQVTLARQAYEKAQADSSWLNSMFGIPDSNVKKAEDIYNQTVGQLFANSGFDPAVQSVAAHIFSDPKLKDLDVETAVSHVGDDQGNPVALTPQQKAQVDQLLRATRGLETPQPFYVSQ